jgi:predicted metal-dependent phosphoesterase TrpH
VIDLHLHTTTSDGRNSPAELVELAAAAGLRVIAVTDHDTTSSVTEVRELARAHGIDAVAGIEVTAVEAGRDVHVLGYFIDPEDATFAAFLAGQRQARVARVAAIAQRLSDIGLPVGVEAVIAKPGERPGRSVGRPQIARAMIAAGYAKSVTDAFDRWLGEGRPAYVPRVGPSPEVVIATIHAAGGVASLAHPGRTRIDSRIAALRDAGLDAIEVFHRDHDAALVTHYARLTADLGLLATGGSDFHGEPGHVLGRVSLPEREWAQLRAAPRPHHG